jgi:HEAT repeat protein
MGIETYLQELADSSRPIRVAKLSNLSQLSDEERRELEEAWPDIEPERRLQLLRQLNDLAEDNPDLNFDAVHLATLRDPEPRVRMAALDGLWEYDDRALIPVLIDMMQSDDDMDVRATAAMSLGHFVVLGEFGSLSPADVALMEEALAGAINDAAEAEDVRARALESLGARSEPWVADLISDAYSSGSQRMQASAIHAMGRSCDVDWLPDVIEQLQSEEPELRYEAATAAGMIADEAVVPHLAFLVHDEDAEVQETAIEALAEIGGSEARAILMRLLSTGDEWVQDAAREALANMELAGADEADEPDFDR